MNRNVIYTLGLCSALSLISACSKSSTTATSSASTPITDAVELVQSGVAKVGTSLSASSLSSARRGANFAVTTFESNMCDSHGIPQSGGSNMNQSAEQYPYAHTYCALTVNDGDTVRGGFDLARSLVCSLEKAGIQFAGAQQTLTITFDSDCWPDGGPEEGVTSLQITATGSSPAAFNSHYERGVVFTVDSLGLEFKMGANLDGDKIEFIALENWSGANAGDSLGDVGVMAGEITKSTGVLKFEKRDERVRSSCTASRCGFNRHTRLLANLTMVNNEPDELQSFQYGYSDIQVSATALGDSGSATTYGKLVTAKGSLSGEIKAKLFLASGKTTAQLKDYNQWTETTNTACASAAGINDAADCSSETGIGKFSASTKFTLFSTPAHTSASDWLSQFTGFNFTSVNVDTDNAF